MASDNLWPSLPDVDDESAAGTGGGGSPVDCERKRAIVATLTEMTDDELGAIETRMAKATGGPWYLRSDGMTVRSKQDETEEMRGRRICITGLDYVRACNWFSQDMDNLEFIAAAREDIPALVAEVRHLRRILAAIAGEVRLQAAHLDEYDDRLLADEREDREELLATFGNLARGIGPDGREVK